MKYHISVKFLAIVLCALFLLTGLASGLGIFFLANYGLYENSPDSLYDSRVELALHPLAYSLAVRSAAAAEGNCPPELLERYMEAFHSDVETPQATRWFYTVTRLDGSFLDSNYAPGTGPYTEYIYHFLPDYPVILGEYHSSTGEALTPTTPRETLPFGETAPTLPDVTEAAYAASPYFMETVVLGWTDPDTGLTHSYELGLVTGSSYRVTLHLMPSAYEPEATLQYQLLQVLYNHRYHLFAVLAGSLLLFAIAAVYLCCAAGRNPDNEDVRPAGLNAMPLDLYLLLAGGVVCAAAVVSMDITTWGDLPYPEWLLLALIAAVCFAAALAAVGFCFAAAAQLKAGGNYLIKRSVIGFSLILLWKGLRATGKWLWSFIPGFGRALFTGCGKLIKGCFRWLKKLIVGIGSGIGAGLRWCGKTVNRFFSLLPLTWQWLVTAAGMGGLFLIAIWSQSVAFVLFAALLCAGIVGYGAHCFGALLESTKNMSQGDLDTKVDTGRMIGGFRDYGTHLNSLADTVSEAAQKQMRSERMKVELVTNVSHDIKTPLTSIINYVDLLQKATTQEETDRYLDVLSRQSLRLKKLIDDLMEMSKASTGNMPVELTTLDAVEAVNQALGEFSAKLSDARLTPVFQPPKGAVPIRADGRLLWRVLSNLLSNAVKYALPGTRLYIDLVPLDGQVVLSVKNISREPLNISSEELMERFVRGDASRNTEGSGLGLNIAKSLMEVQHGQLQLLVDGDLFKVTLVFPGIEDQP